MKKLFISALFALALITSAFAAPAKALNHFKATFAKAKNVSWTVTDEFAKATFMENNEKVEIFYTTDGEMIGTSKTMAYNKLPKKALDVLTTKYTFPEFQLKDCIEFTDASNYKSFYLSFDTKDENLVLEVSPYGLVTVLSRSNK